MLDKSADASTVRTLVRRDVAAFEQNCGAVDPDAVAAFKSLLTAKAAPPPAAQGRAARRSQERRQRTRAPAGAGEATGRQAEAKPAVTESEPARHGTEVSDANWLAAVRGALVTTTMCRRAPNRRRRCMRPCPVRPCRRARAVEARGAPLNLAPPAPELAPVPAAPALPPATSVAAAPAPKVDSSHPVPPGSIPEAAPASEATANPSRARAGARC